MNKFNFKTATSWYRSLSLRERRLLLLSSVAILCIVLWWSINSLVELHAEYQKKMSVTSSLVPEVITLSNRVKGLDFRLTELTTLYLNSTLSYEELTNYLDALIKKNTGDDSYSLNRSNDSEKIGNSFQLQKFTVKIQDSSLSQITNLLQALETGSPRMFIQRAEIKKNRTKGTLSLSLEIASVQAESTN